MNIVNLEILNTLFTAKRFMVFILAIAVLFLNNGAVLANSKDNKQSFEFSEGKVCKAVVTAGLFDLHRKYRSMEGPYISFNFKVGDIVASKQVNLPEGMVIFVEGNSNTAPSMMGTAAGSNITKDVQGLANTSNEPRTLLWLKGVKLEVLDENDQVLPTAEFICHWNLDVNPAFRNKIFTDGDKCQTVRLATITQGQTEITFPDGYGVPVASDETWNAVFQAANRTTDEHKRIKHRCTFYFIKDSDLVYPITALSWYVPWIYVVIDKNSPQAAEAEKNNCPSCLGLSMGINAPNNTSNGTFTDSKGRRLSGHWVIPPGTHSYTTTINDEMEPGFASKPHIIHAVWSHVHPLCSNLSLYECKNNLHKKLFSVGAKTETAHGLEIKNIEYWSSKKGIAIPANVNYELAVTYKNTTGVPQDSMAAAGIFFEDPTFARPDWVLHAKDGYACSMIKSGSSEQDAPADSTQTQTNASAIVKTPEEIAKLPLFELSKDGPLLTQAKSVKLETNAGPIILYIDPSLAPITATQVYRLLNSNVFNGTRIFRYEPNFILQISTAEDKAPGQRGITDESKALLRRIPLEVSAQKPNETNHLQYVLSMAHYSDMQDSAVSSFSIMLQNAPHLDHQFAIFGKIGEDAATRETLSKIERNWDSNKYWIIGTKVL